MPVAEESSLPLSSLLEESTRSKEVGLALLGAARLRCLRSLLCAGLSLRVCHSAFGLERYRLKGGSELRARLLQRLCFAILRRNAEVAQTMRRASGLTGEGSIRRLCKLGHLSHVDGFSVALHAGNLVPSGS